MPVLVFLSNLAPYTYLKAVFNVDMNFLYINKVFHYFLMASFSCIVQGDSLLNGGNEQNSKTL